MEDPTITIVKSVADAQKLIKEINTRLAICDCEIRRAKKYLALSLVLAALGVFALVLRYFLSLTC